MSYLIFFVGPIIVVLSVRLSSYRACQDVRSLFVAFHVCNFFGIMRATQVLRNDARDDLEGIAKVLGINNGYDNRAH